MKLLPVVALLAACGPPSPENTEVEAPARAEAVLTAARAGWEIHLGKLPGLPEVRWFSGDCIRYPDETDPGCTLGVTWSGPSWDTEIHGLESRVELVAAHELLHWALDEKRGDPDSDHTDPLWVEALYLEDTL